MRRGNMDTNYIRTLYEFNAWANERTFEAVSKPAPELLRLDSR